MSNIFIVSIRVAGVGVGWLVCEQRLDGIVMLRQDPPLTGDTGAENIITVAT